MSFALSGVQKYKINHDKEVLSNRIVRDKFHRRSPRCGGTESVCSG